MFRVPTIVQSFLQEKTDGYLAYAAIYYSCLAFESCICDFGLIFIIDIVGTFAQVRSMIAESFVPLPYTVELWQFSHEQTETWYQSFDDRDRDIILVCAQPDFLVHLATGPLKKKYDWHEASKQTKQNGYILPVLSHTGNCFEN